MGVVEDLFGIAVLLAGAAITYSGIRKAERTGRSLVRLWAGRPVYRSKEPDDFRRVQRFKTFLVVFLLVLAALDALELLLRLVAA